MSQFQLRPSGQAPIRFNGELLVEQSSQHAGGREHNRWHEVRLYRTEGGTYVVDVVYWTQWEGEQNYHWALEAAEASSVEMRLREIGAELNRPVKGYPAGAAYEQRQARLLDDLQQRFEVLISDVLAADDAFARWIQ